MQDLNDLYFFAEVVQRGSFTAAARALGITTSRISRRIADLEERLGVRLLHRTTRKLSLTDIGQVYFEHCQAMVAEAAAAQEAIEHVRVTPRGRVRVSCPVLTAQSRLGEMISRYMARYPEVRISVNATDRRVDLVEEGVDVAIRFRAEPLADSNLVVRAIGYSHTYLVGSPQLLDRVGRPQDPVDLSRYRSLAKTAPSGLYSWPLSGPGERQQAVAHQPDLDSDDWMILRQGACDGLGLVALPDEVCLDDVRGGRLEVVLPEWSLPTARLYIVYPSRRGLVPAVRSFIDYVAAELALIYRAPDLRAGADPEA